MTLGEYLEKDCRRASGETWNEFHLMSLHLPKRDENTPYHSTAPNLTAISDALAIAESRLGRALTILEIGYNLGHSREMIEETHVASRIVSVDISPGSKELAEEAEHIPFVLGDTFNRNTWDEIRSHGPYDLALIDGDHSEAGVENDLRGCIEIGIRWFLMDDIHPHWGPGVLPAIARHNLKIHAVLGSMALCELTDPTWKSVDEMTS